MQAITKAFEEREASGFNAERVRRCTTTERNRGPLETRTCMVCPASAALRKNWVALKMIGPIDRQRVLNDGTKQF